MDASDIDGISAWLVERGLCGDSEVTLLQGFCERCHEAGLLLSRGTAIIDTLHPVYEGRAFFWARDKAVPSPVSEYGPTTSGDSLSGWQRSPFYHLLQGSENELRRRLESDEPTGFDAIDELRAEGQTDYVAFIQRFGQEAAIGEMDCFLSRWLTIEPGGFSDADIGALRRLVPLLGLAIKSTSLARVAQSLVETYLRRDAGRRVLAGRMSRGAVDKIQAVLWFSDIRGYTALSEQMATDQLIPLLDDYAEAVISAIHGAGGDVLKLIGDGVLAIFNADDPAAASCAALAAEAALHVNLAALKEKRTAAGMPVASIYIGMHIGDVFYGNIGSKDRLDFTVVGEAVNEASRISNMCASVGREILLSSEFVAALPDQERSKLVSVGRYALRGVRRPQELFTLDPDVGA